MAAAYPPRPSVERTSGTLDFPDRYGFQMQRWKDSINRQGTEEVRSYQEFLEIQRYIAMLTGDYWSSNRPAWRSRFYDNYLADLRRESLSSLSDMKPSIDISSPIEAFRKTSEVIHKTIRSQWWRYNLDLHVVSVLDHALFGSGFIKQTAGFNQFEWSAHGLDQVVPVLCDGDIQQSAAVIYKAYKGIPYFQAKFGTQAAAGLERESVSLSRSLGLDQYARPDSIPEYTWQAMSPGMKRRMNLRNGPSRTAASDYSPFPVIELQEIYTDDWSTNDTGHDVLVKHPDLNCDEHNFHYIVPPGARLFPRKRLTIFAGNRVMYDGPSPFWHGQYPFVMLQLNPCVWAPGGISKYRDLVPLVLSINRTGAGIEESVWRALNGLWVGRRGAVPEDVFNAFIPGMPGQKILLNPIASPQTDFVERTAPQLPSQVGEWLKYCVATVRKRGGSMDVGDLQRKKQVPGGDSIEQMRDVLSGPFRLESRYVESWLERCGVQMVSNIIQFATVSGRMQLLGGDGLTPEDFDFDAGSLKPVSSPREDYWKQFAFKISPGSTHGSSQSQKKVEAFTMYKAGALSMAGLYRQTGFPENVQQVQQEMQQEHQEGIGQVPKGRQPRQTRGQRNGSPV